VNEPPSPTVGAEAATVVGADEQDAVDVDVDRWSRLAHAVLAAEGAVGELTLTFVDEDEIAALNAEHLGQPGPTDVLSFPLDAAAEAPGGAGVPNGVFTVHDAAAEAPAREGSASDERHAARAQSAAEGEPPDRALAGAHHS
jgi:probable rRNA maturation factor